MFCKHCGGALEQNVEFCPKCGTSVNVAAAVDQPVSMPDGAKLVGTGQILKTAWANYKSKFWKLIGLQVLAVLPILVIAMIGGLAANTWRPQGAVVLITLGIIGCALLILIIFWSIWMQASLMQALLDDSSRTIKESINAVKPKLHSYFWGSVVSGIITVLATVLFIVPGIIFGIWFAFSSFIVLAEGAKGVRSIRLSKEYVKGYWWAVFGRFILVMLIIIVFYIIVGIAAAGLNSITGMNEVGSILQNIFSMVVGPFLSACLLVIYLGLKSIKGQVTVSPEGDRKYTVVAIIGVILIPLIIIASVVLMALNAPKDKIRSPQQINVTN